MEDLASHKKFTSSGSEYLGHFERSRYDFYSAEPIIINELFEREMFITGTVWDCSCADGLLTKRMRELGKKVRSSDITDRGYGNECVDFLSIDEVQEKTHIITYPAYKCAQAFVEKSLELVQDRYKVALFLKLIFLSGQQRHEFFKRFPPKYVYAYSSRRNCILNGWADTQASTLGNYAWFIWEKGYKKEPVIRWII